MQANATIGLTRDQSLSDGPGSTYVQYISKHADRHSQEPRLNADLRIVQLSTTRRQSHTIDTNCDDFRRVLGFFSIPSKTFRDLGGKTSGALRPVRSQLQWSCEHLAEYPDCVPGFQHRDNRQAITTLRGRPIGVFRRGRTHFNARREAAHNAEQKERTRFDLQLFVAFSASSSPSLRKLFHH